MSQASTPRPQVHSVSPNKDNSNTPRNSSAINNIIEAEEYIPVQLTKLQETKLRLEHERKLAENAGKYNEAAELLQKIKQLNLLEAQRVERQLKTDFEREKIELDERQMLEVKAFEGLWHKKLQEYDDQAKEIIRQTIERQNWEKKEAETTVRNSVLHKKPKFSKKVLDMRVVLKKLVQKMEYTEAEVVRKELATLELDEMEVFQQQLENLVQSKLKINIQKSQQEIDSLKQRIKQGRNELMLQRKQDWERLVQYHNNLQQELKLKQKKQLSKTDNYVQKTNNLIRTIAAKTAVDLSIIQSPHGAVNSPYAASPRSFSSASAQATPR